MSLRAPAFSAAKAKLRSLASPIFSVGLALFAATGFAYLNVIWDPGYYGDFGLVTDGNNPEIVAQVLSDSPAAKADIRVGDRISRPRTLHERLLLFGVESPGPSERVTLSIARSGADHTVTLQARPLPPLGVTDRVLLALQCAWLFVFLLMGLALVWIRPSKMTWAFYLFAINLVLILGPNQLPRGPDGWIVAGSIFAHDLIAPTGVAGFLVFCVLFPANMASGWRRTIELLAPYTAVIIAAHLLYQDGYALFPVWNAAGYGEFAIFAAIFAAYFVTTAALLKQRARVGERERREIAWVCAFLIFGMLATLHDILLTDFIGPWSFLFIFLLGTLVFIITFVAASGLERHRMTWVAFGFVCASVASTFDFLWFGNAPVPWFISALDLLWVALPATVAYAVVRHRVIDIRFVASRALTFTIIALLLGIVFAGVDWLFSTRLPSSRFEAAIYGGLALLVGFSLNAGRERISKTIDLVFFREWHHAQEQATTIVDTIGHAASKPELYEPLTVGIGKAFSLASVALFERIEDGGFVRVADSGWPPGLTWHILPDDPVALRAIKTSRVLHIASLQWQQTDLPAGIARPTTLFPMISAKRSVAILLCGAHEDGAGLSSDEIRTIRKACSDGAFVYDRPSRSYTTLSTQIEQRQQLSV